MNFSARNAESHHTFRIFIVAFIVATVFSSFVVAQVSANLAGLIMDPSGAAISGASVVATNAATGISRTGVTDQTGRYRLFALPVGEYEVRVTRDGFAEGIRTGIRLVAGQEATVDVGLKLGAVSQQVKVAEDASVVSVTTQDISGLVGERQVKDLPLNGRSYDLLLTLNPGIVNFTWEKTGGIGVSNSTTGNNFSVSGNRPQQNLFLLNGVEYTGAAENNMQPGGSSQQLLGVDAVRELNVLRDSYGAEYGKRPGGQIVIVTQSGTNQLHGTAYEFLRNNALDAANYFDEGSAPPFQRNQFGAALGGPIRKDKTFLFGNYEGLRQHLHQTSVAFVPSEATRATVAPSVVPLLNLWPVPAPGAQDFDGISQVFSSPLQTIREDFGTVRADHIFSDHDSLSGVYTIDDGEDVTATILNPYSSDLLTLREQVVSIDEMHSFSPATINAVRVGYSRAGYFFTGEPTPGTPATNVPGFLLGHQVGAVVVGGSAASNPSAQVGLAGSNNGSNLKIARNLYTIEDRVMHTRGRHQIMVGAWFQPFQSNETIALSQYGQATFTSIQTFKQGTISSFLYDPAPTEMNWRSLFGAGYVEDVIRISSKLMLSLGFRAEFTTGWNEKHGRAANYRFDTAGLISTEPQISHAFFTTNNAKFLPQPRMGIAWSPLNNKTVFRGGFGMYKDLQDALGYRADQNAPFNPVYSLPLSVSSFPIDPKAPVPAGAKLVPGGVQPDMKTPTLISWSLRMQHEISPDTSFTVGYIGSHGYHEIVGFDANEPFPVLCPASPCPAVYPANFPVGLANTPVPAGTLYIPSGTPKANPNLNNTWTWFSVGNSNYNALQVDLNRRFSHGLSLRGVYTWSKSLDDGDSVNGTTTANAPGLVSNPFNLHADYGLATYDVRHVGVISSVYELPVGHGQPLWGSSEGWRNVLASGWSVNNIVTLQSGFPFTPQLSYNPSNNGDTRNPVRPFVNPNFRGSVILGRSSQWFDPHAFLAPPPNSGFYGDLGRDTLIGPGLATWDFSAFKTTDLYERLRLQFRAEIFNLTNRANFNTPNLITFTPSGISGTAGAITSTSTAARQVQFGLKLIW